LERGAAVVCFFMAEFGQDSGQAGFQVVYGHEDICSSFRASPTSQLREYIPHALVWMHARNSLVSASAFQTLLSTLKNPRDPLSDIYAIARNALWGIGFGILDRRGAERICGNVAVMKQRGVKPASLRHGACAHVPPRLSQRRAPRLTKALSGGRKA
jgi:hypothetical protein